MICWNFSRGDSTPPKALVGACGRPSAGRRVSYSVLPPGGEKCDSTAGRFGKAVGIHEGGGQRKCLL